ncbi:hypothetical protein G647_00966 [Cladophialophora carrionii CBS 160.54]|uniref:Uncharacterized protein n=1 Tax=Cladophialophora carrionii CBS 160.54 TaxID=1279043 RepID=V9DPD7_9EURO|nr:uncharacterized protein G647_00966 [Cladophialophora carrionii CBS 160.54]ETI28516.1 hypothetical protein G647_00966 [Cladophialophora carrionii CBS 160.54]
MEISAQKPGAPLSYRVLQNRLRHRLYTAQPPVIVYAARRFHRKGERFNNQEGTCLPDAGLPDREADAVNAELEAVAVPVPKLAIRQLHALLTLLASAEQPPKRNILGVGSGDGVTGLTAFVRELEVAVGVVVVNIGPEAEVDVGPGEVGVGVLVFAKLVVVLTVELAVLELVLTVLETESEGNVEVKALMLDDELSRDAEEVDTVDEEDG